MCSNLLSYIVLQSGQFHQSIRQQQQQQQQQQQHFALGFSRGAIKEAQGRVSAMLTPTHQDIKQQVQSASLIHADETRHKRGGERCWMWMALSKIAVCFMTAYGRGIDATIAQSGEHVNQPLGARLVLLANSVFRARHRVEQTEGISAQAQALLAELAKAVRARLGTLLKTLPWSLRVAHQE